MPTTNLERWRYYCETILSPASYIDWCFHYLILASLQRRVWRGQIGGNPLFANPYIILTGEPGVGKGIILKEVSKVLRFHKLEAKNEYTADTTPAQSNALGQGRKEQALLFPVGADASTYEALVREISRAIRPFWREVDGKKRAYLHSSLCFCLEEISSLFRKHSEDLVRFLLVTYDCGDYRYETISRGTDYIKNCCLALLGGTTPKFLRRVFSDELLNEGFASRCIFVFELCNRFDRLRPPEFNEDQVKEHKIILDHIKKLSTLYGEVKFTPEASEYLEHWNKTDKYKRPNTSPKLNYYYARKPVTMQKLAIGIHFADSVTMEVNLDECIEARKLLDNTEKRMHFALTNENKNPLAEVTDSIYDFIAKNGGQTKKDLLVLFWSELPNGTDSLDDALSYLNMVNKVKLKDKQYIIPQ